MPASSIPFWEMAGSPVREAAQQLGIPISAGVVGKLDRDAYERVFDEMQVAGVDGLMVGDATEHITDRLLIISLAAKHRLPTVYPYREYVDDGGLLSYGANTTEVHRRLANIADQILKGTKPGDIPYTN